MFLLWPFPIGVQPLYDSVVHGLELYGDKYESDNGCNGLIQSSNVSEPVKETVHCSLVLDQVLAHLIPDHEVTILRVLKWPEGLLFDYEEVKAFNANHASDHDPIVVELDGLIYDLSCNFLLTCATEREPNKFSRSTQSFVSVGI